VGRGDEQETGKNFPHDSFYPDAFRNPDCQDTAATIVVDETPTFEGNKKFDFTIAVC